MTWWRHSASAWAPAGKVDHSVYDDRALVITLALLGAVIAMAAAVGRLSGRLGEGAAQRLYYVSYGCTGLSIALFIARGLLAARP
jgi:hypothetical protein